MTNKLKKLLEDVLQDDEAVDLILNDKAFGRKSVRDRFNVSRYYSQQIIDAVQHSPEVDLENKKVLHGQPEEPDNLVANERQKEPISAENWEMPDSWVYDKNFVYNEDDDKFIFMTREFGNIVRPGRWVKSLVKAYSDWDGEPETITEVCRRFGITRGVFNAIKSILGLTHDHEPFTPVEVENKSPEEMAMEAHQMKRFQTKVEFDKLDWKETQKEAKQWRQLKQSIIDEVNIEAPAIIVEPIEPTGKDVEVEDIVLHTADWHNGALAKGLPNVPDFDHEILKGHIHKMVDLVRTDFPESRVHLHFGGDIMETVTGMNHPDSWKNIEPGYYGSKAILSSEQLLLNLITGLQAHSMRAVTGNHGRLTSDRKKDHSGEAELIIYEHLRQRLPGIDIQYSETEAIQIVGGIGYLLSHGHLRLSGKSEQNIIQAIIRKFNKPVDFVLYEQGHEHARDIKADTNLFRHLVMPALFTGHDYNERNGYGQLAGFLVSYVHPHTGKLKIEDYSL